jgi:hypothetical protein
LLCCAFISAWGTQWTVQNLQHIKFRSSKAVCQNSHEQIRDSQSEFVRSQIRFSQISHFSQNSAVFFQNSLSGPQTRVSVSQSANFLFFFIYLFIFLFVYYTSIVWWILLEIIWILILVLMCIGFV